MSAGTTRLRGDDEPQTSKRARYTIEEEESSQGSLSENSLNNSESEDTTPYQNYVLKVDQTDGFVEGSIVRIALTNFVTYDYCEVFPGPQMNLIIGPNGTGKSTIVCAIALGLGGSPSLLGRAKNIQEFVKTGQDEAKITIELKKANERNVVIQRSFKKSSNSTLWKVNGKSIAYKEVMNIIHGFNIQVDNLCQFLPQDRVVEFAGMSPIQLLEKTQLAAGETKLHEMQKQLIDWREDQKGFQRSHQSDLEHANALKERNRKLEQDVLRMQLKQKISDKIKLLKAQEPLVRYSQSRKQLDEYKDALDTQKEVVQKVNAEYAPLQKRLKVYENDLKRLLVDHNKEKSNLMEKELSMKNTLAKAKALREKMDSIKAEIKAIETRIPQKKQKMRNIQHEIKEAEEATREPPNSDTSEIENSIAKINDKLSDNRYDIKKLADKSKAFSINKKEQIRGLENAKKKVEDMKNVRNIRLEALRSRHSDTFKAYEWLKENKDQFSAKVYSPILLEINLKDSQYAAHIEQVLGGFRSNIFRTFLFESKEDYLKFNRIMITERKLRVTTAWPGEFSKDVLKTPSTTEELRNKFKFEYYIADLIRAPDFVLKYLCLENKINLIPVSLQQVEEERIVNSGIFKRFTAAQNHYRVKNSRYSDSYQTEVTVLRPAQLLNDSVDIELKNSLIDKMKTHHSNILQCEQDTKEVAKEVEDINQVIRELEFEKSDLQSKKRDVTIEAQKYERTKNLLRQKKSELAELESEPEADQQNVERLKEKKSLLLDEESQHLSRFTLLSKELLDVLKKSNQKQIEQVEAMARFDRLKSYIRDQSAALEEAQKSLEGFKRQYDYLAQRVTGYMNQAREAGQELTGELKEAFKEIITQFKEGGETEFSTLEELSLKIAEKEGEAAAISYNDPNAMKHYEERVAQIEKLNRKIEKDKAGMEKLESKITQLRERWEPRIDQLVRSISENFTNAFESIIGCTGEVGIDKQEDFDKWGIQILVKFRDTEKLQILTSQRQSGGERSVATSLYLMSLQNLAKSPFRVVDEINQGMDPRNERMIHKRIVEGASRSGTSQYFLITPKLLPDLHYNEQVRVLCIHNGEWIPVKMNPVAKYLEHARKNPALIH